MSTTFNNGSGFPILMRDYSYWRYYSTGAIWSTLTDVYGQGFGVVSYKQWERDPLFRSKIKAKPQGLLLDQPFQYRHQQSDGGDTIYRQNLGTGSERVGKITTLAHLGHVQRRSNLASYNTAINRCIGKAKGHQFMAPVFLAEAGKTAVMVYQQAIRIVDILLTIKRGRFDHAMQMLRFAEPPSRRKVKRSKARFNKEFAKDARKACGNWWLEWTYGVAPFMHDLQDAVNATFDAQEEPSKLIGRVVGSHTYRDQYVTTPSPFGDWGHGEHVVRSDTWRVVWRFRPNPADLWGRFGLTNPLTTIWELVPLSFVGDWFFPIGEWLSHLDTALRYEHVGGTVGSRISEIRVLRSVRYTYGNMGCTFQDHERKLLDITRSVLTGVPTPSLNGYKLKGPLEQSASHAVSAIALLQASLKWLR